MPDLNAGPNAGPIRLVVTDVDGTLVKHDKTLAPGTIAAVNRLREAGIKFGLVSSRPPHGLDVLLAPLGIDTPRAGFNGGEVLGPDDARLSELLVDAGAVRAAVEHLTANKVDSWIFGDGKWFLANPDAHYIPREKLSVSLDPTLVADLSPYYGRVHKLMATCEDFALMARMEAEIAALLGDRATVLRSQNYYLDVTHPQANKGYAAQQLARLLNIPDSAMCCLGDMPNDVPMFRVAGMSVAMSNGPEAVQKQAQYVTGDAEGTGWADAIDRYVLPRAP